MNRAIPIGEPLYLVNVSVGELILKQRHNLVHVNPFEPVHPPGLGFLNQQHCSRRHDDAVTVIPPAGDLEAKRRRGKGRAQGLAVERRGGGAWNGHGGYTGHPRFFLLFLCGFWRAGVKLDNVLRQLLS